MDKEKSLPLFLSNTFDSKRLVENKMEGWQVIEHENKFRIIKESRTKVFDIHFNIRRSRRRCSVKKKGVLRNFVKFTGKHLRKRLFFNKVAVSCAGVFL